MIDHVRLLTREGRTSRLNKDLADTVPGGDVEQIAISRLTADEAVAVLAANLPPEQVDVILLRVLGGFTSSEVAKLIGKRAGAVRAMQARALARLAEALPREEVADPRQEARL